MGEAVGDGAGPGGLGGVEGDRLVDGLDVGGRPGGAAGVGRDVAAALVEVQAGVAAARVVQDADRRDRAVLQNSQLRPCSPACGEARLRPPSRRETGPHFRPTVPPAA